MFVQKVGGVARASALLMAGIAVVIACGLAACGPNKPAGQTQTQTSAAATDSAPAAHTRTILFLGTSLTAGYGIDVNEAYPALIQRTIDSLHLPYTVVNAGLSGETSAGGLRRIGWLLRQPVDVLHLELGANDGLRGIPVADTRKNLSAIVDSVRAHNPRTIIFLAGMMAPPNMGPEFTNGFKELFPQLAEEKNLVLVPFLLQDVAGVAQLNQTDGIHPLPQGHVRLARNVWQVMGPVLQQEAARNP
jgi:acyl-CoA thioesterase-1